MKNNLQRSILYVATIFIGLLLSSTAFFGFTNGIMAEMIVSFFVWALFINIYRKTDRKERVEMLTVLAFATPMELFFSEIWLIYEYQRGLMPLFVPAGHYFLFDLGRICVQNLNNNITYLGLLPLIPFVMYGWYDGSDTSAVLLLVLVIAFIRYGRESQLYVVMVWLALAMELWGTYLMNWTWSNHVPWTGLTAWNPPLLVGAFYCLGDLLVVWSVAKFESKPKVG